MTETQCANLGNILADADYTDGEALAALVTEHGTSALLSPLFTGGLAQALADPARQAAAHRALGHVKMAARKRRLPLREFDSAIKVETQALRAAKPTAAGGEWEERPDGLYHFEVTQKAAFWAPITLDPLTVTAGTEGSRDGAKGVLVRFQDRDGGCHEVEVPWAEIHTNGDTILSYFASRGLRLAPPFGHTGKRFLEYVGTRRPQERRIAADFLGWSDDGTFFVLPDRVIGAVTSVVPSLKVGAVHEISSRGRRAAWEAVVAEILPGNSMAALALGGSLAAPLLRLLGVPGGGFHLVSPAKHGKTLLLAIAASLWGPPDRQQAGGRSFVSSWGATVNGMETLLAARNDLPALLDELSEVPSPDMIANAVYMLANGGGKSRMSWTLERREPKAGRLLILSTGEQTIAEKTRNASRGPVTAGATFRLADVNAIVAPGTVFETMPDPVRQAPAIYRRLGQAYGHAGPNFIERLLDDFFPDPLQAIRQDFEEFLAVRPVDDGGVTVRFAACHAALRAAARFGIVPISEDEAGGLIAAVADRWRQSFEQQREQEGLEAVCTWAAKHAARLIEYELDKQGAAAKVIKGRFDDPLNPIGWRRISQDGQACNLLVLDAAGWKTLCGELGRTGGALADDLRRTGALEHDPDRVTKKVSLPTAGRPRCHVIDLAKIGGEQEKFAVPNAPGNDEDAVPEVNLEQ